MKDHGSASRRKSRRRKSAAASRSAQAARRTEAPGRLDEHLARAIAPAAGQPAGVSAWRTAELDGNAALQRLASGPGMWDATPAQRAARAQADEDAQADHALRALGSSGGRPIPAAQLARFEAAFGHDFSHVRIHDDAQAIRAADAIHAHAFAVGADIYFGGGELALGSAKGDRLLAHELTHVVQHDEGRLPTGGGVSSPSDPAEQEAYGNEDRILGRLAGLGDMSASTTPTPSMANAAHTTTDRSEAPVQAAPHTRAMRDQDKKEKPAELTLPEDGKPLFIGDFARFVAAGPSMAGGYLKVRLSKQWLLDNGASAADATVQIPAVNEAVIAGLEIQYGAEFHPKGRETAVEKCRLVLGAPLTDQAAIFETPVSASILGFTGLPLHVKEAQPSLHWTLEKGESPDDPGLVPHVDVYIRTDSEDLPPAAAEHITKSFASMLEVPLPQGTDLASVLVLHESGPNTMFTRITWNALKALYQGKQSKLVESVRRNFNAGEKAKSQGATTSGGGGAPKTSQPKPEGKGTKMAKKLLGPIASVPPSIKVDDALWALQFLKENFGTKKSSEENKQASRLTPELLAALRALDAHSDKLKILRALKQEGPGQARLNAHAIQDAIAAQDLSNRRSAAGLEDITRHGDGRPPILDTPVRGWVRSLNTKPILSKRPAKFWFQTDRLKDSFRSAWVRVEWLAFDQEGNVVHQDTCHYQEDDQSETFDVTFDTPGTYRIYCYVRHTYYRDNDFGRPGDPAAIYTVVDEAVHHSQQEQANLDMIGRVDTLRPEQFDRGLDNEWFGDLDYTQGQVIEGQLNPNRDRTTALEQLQTMAQHLSAMLDEYVRREDKKMIDHTRIMLGRVNQLIEELQGDIKGGYQTLEVQAMYTSGTPGLKDRSLDLSGVVTVQGSYNETSQELTYTVKLRDFTMHVSSEPIEVEGEGATFKSALKEAYTELIKSYPNGRMSLVAALPHLQPGTSDYLKPSDRFIQLGPLKTDSVWKDVKSNLFSPVADMAVNGVAMVLMGIPGAQAWGIGLSMAYNSIQTAGQLVDLHSRGQLTVDNAATPVVGLMVDLIPAISAGAASKLGQKLVVRLNRGSLAGTGLVITMSLREEVNKLRDKEIMNLLDVETALRANEQALAQARNGQGGTVQQLLKKRAELLSQRTEHQQAFRKAADEVMKSAGKDMILLAAGQLATVKAAGRLLRSGKLSINRNVQGARVDAKTGKIEANPDATRAEVEAAIKQAAGDGRAKAVVSSATDQQPNVQQFLADKARDLGEARLDVNVVKSGRPTVVRRGNHYYVVLPKQASLNHVKSAFELAERLHGLEQQGLFKRGTQGKEPSFNPDTGQIQGDPGRFNDNRLNRLLAEQKAHKAEWETRLAERFGAESASLTRNPGRASVTRQGNKITVNIPPTRKIGPAVTGLQQGYKRKQGAKHAPPPKTPGSKSAPVEGKRAPQDSGKQAAPANKPASSAPITKTTATKSKKSFIGRVLIKNGKVQSSVKADLTSEGYTVYPKKNGTWVIRRSDTKNQVHYQVDPATGKIVKPQTPFNQGGSSKLAKNMGDRPEGKYQAHHIIPSAVVKKAGWLKRGWKEGWWKLNGKHNGKWLPSEKSSSSAHHNGPHPKYSGVATNKVNAAWDQLKRYAEKKNIELTARHKQGLDPLPDVLKPEAQKLIRGVQDGLKKLIDNQDSSIIDKNGRVSDAEGATQGGQATA